LLDCGAFVIWEAGKQCHVIFFVRGYSLQQFQRRYGNRHFDFSTNNIILKKDYFEPIDEGAPHQT
jgi:hypothetical protein